MVTPGSKQRGAAQTVVLADNDPILLDAIAEVLRAKGYDVQCATDGLETLEAIRRLKPSYVILDIVMPKIDGSRVCWLIRQDPALRDTPVIALSALSPEQIRRFPELSADAYVAKGPLAVVANHLLMAIKYLEGRERRELEGGIFGYEGFRSRRLVSEMLGLKRYWEALVRIFDQGVLGLDEEGRVLLVNPAASRLLGKREPSMVGLSLQSLVAAQDRPVVQQIIGELKKARLSEDRHVEVTVRDRRIHLRLSNIVEDGACSGMLAILQSKTSSAKARTATDSA